MQYIAVCFYTPYCCIPHTISNLFDMAVCIQVAALLHSVHTGGLLARSNLGPGSLNQASGPLLIPKVMQCNHGKCNVTFGARKLY